MLTPETEYLLLRAKDETIAAIQAGHPAAAAAHGRLALSYSERAATELAGDAPEPAPGPTLEPPAAS